MSSMHQQWHQVKRRRSAYTADTPLADDREHYRPARVHYPQQCYGAVPPVSRTSTAAARRMSVAAAPSAPVPFTESLAARSNECGCCSCVAAAARAYNASQQAHATAHPRPVSQAERPQVRSFEATRRTSDSSRRHYAEPHYLEARPAAWTMRRGLESRHLTSDIQQSTNSPSADGKRPTKRIRRAQQLDDILDATLDASRAWESQERPRPAPARLPTFTLVSVEGLSHSWATGIIQSASSPSSSVSSPSSAASSPAAPPATTADRSSFSWQVVTTPLPTLVSTSSSPTVSYLPTTASAIAAEASAPALASPSAEPEQLFGELQTEQGDDEWFGFLLRRADSGGSATTRSPSSPGW